MLPFELTPLGVKILFNYCKKNSLFETTLIKGLTSSEFIVRRKKDKWIYNTFNLGVLFKIEGEDGETNSTLFPDTNLILELEIDELNKLIDIMNFCRDKGGWEIS